MKWLLVTNFGNPGDEFVRLGVERLIRASDSQATFDYVRRDEPGIATPRTDYDRAVVCGMPLLWSLEENTTLTHPSWPHLSGWLKQRRLQFAGAGSYLTSEAAPAVVKEIKGLLAACEPSYCRDEITSHYLGLPAMPCPSIFAGMDYPTPPTKLRIANLMPTLTHYPRYSKHLPAKWEGQVKAVAKRLLDEGFVFAAHSPAERSYAQTLGWPEDRLVLFNGDTTAMLRLYSQASHYFGNRIHGAIVSRGFGARVLCVGGDTRLSAVREVGGTAVTPDWFDLERDFPGFLDSIFASLNLPELFGQQLRFFA